MVFNHLAGALPFPPLIMASAFSSGCSDTFISPEKGLLISFVRKMVAEMDVAHSSRLSDTSQGRSCIGLVGRKRCIGLDGIRGKHRVRYDVVGKCRRACQGGKGCSKCYRRECSGF
jgi:hypothetical protein